MAAASPAPLAPVKVEWCGDRRRLRLPGPVPRFEALQAAVWKVYEGSAAVAAARSGVATPHALAFTYVDEDGDPITVSSQLGLDEASRLAPGGGRGAPGLLRLSVARAAPPVAVVASPVAAGVGSPVLVQPPTEAATRGAAPPPAYASVAPHGSHPAVHPALVALGHALTALEPAGYTPADGVDMARVGHALGVSPKLFAKLGLIDPPSFRAWKAQHWFRGGLVDPPVGPAEGDGYGGGGGGGGDGGCDGGGASGDGGDGAATRVGGGGAAAGPRSSSKVRAARFAEHVTYDDEAAVVAPGAEVCKIWRVMNDSGAPWPARVGLASTSDAGFHAQLDANVGGLADGAEADVVANVVCPRAPGRHRGVWRLFDVDTGRRFGSRLWMTVVVGDAGSEGRDAVVASGVAAPHGEMPPPVAYGGDHGGAASAHGESEQPPA